MAALSIAATAAFDDSAWEAITLPGFVKPFKPGKVFWMRANYVIPDCAPSRLWFLTRKGARDAASVRKALYKIAEGSSETADRLDEVRRATEEQKRASVEIRGSMESLAAASASIRAEAERQAAYSARVRAAVALISAAAIGVRNSAASIMEDGAGLVAAVGELRDLTTKGSELTLALSLGRGAES